MRSIAVSQLIYPHELDSAKFECVAHSSSVPGVLGYIMSDWGADNGQARSVFTDLFACYYPPHWPHVKLSIGHAGYSNSRYANI